MLRSNSVVENWQSICCCHGHLLGQSFVSSDSERCLLQVEDHSGSRSHSFPGLCYMRSGTSPECFRGSPELEGSWENRQDGTARLEMRFSVLLNSWENFFVTLPSISWETWLMESPCDLGTFEFCATLILVCSSQFYLFSAASFHLFSIVASSYGKRNDQQLIPDCLFTEGKSICFLTVSKNTK